MSDEGLIVIMSVLSGHHPALVSSQSQRSFCLTTLPQDLRTFYVLNAEPGMNYDQHQNANQNWMITFKSCVSAEIMCCMIITWLLCLLSCHRDLVSCLYSLHHIVYTLQGIILANDGGHIEMFNVFIQRSFKFDLPRLISRALSTETVHQ